jgi:hypothetical protein
MRRFTVRTTVRLRGAVAHQNTSFRIGRAPEKRSGTRLRATSSEL